MNKERRALGSLIAGILFIVMAFFNVIAGFVTIIDNDYVNGDYTHFEILSDPEIEKLSTEEIEEASDEYNYYLVKIKVKSNGSLPIELDYLYGFFDTETDGVYITYEGNNRDYDYKFQYFDYEMIPPGQEGYIYVTLEAEKDIEEVELNVYEISEYDSDDYDETGETFLIELPQ